MLSHALLLLLHASVSFPGSKVIASTRLLGRLRPSPRADLAQISEEELLQHVAGSGRRGLPARLGGLFGAQGLGFQGAKMAAAPELSGGTLSAHVNGRKFDVLQGVGGAIEATAESEGRGLFLSFDGEPDRSEHLLSLGSLGCTRLLAAARTKRWWMGPCFGNDASAVPPETQFVLLELADDAYALLLPLVSGSMRATLRGSEPRRRKRDTFKGDKPRLSSTDANLPGPELIAQVQSGDPSTKASGMQRMMFVATGDDPFELLERSFTAAADALGTFDVSKRKTPAADLDLFGWCTWDAFYQAVDPDGIRSGLTSLHGAGTPPRMLIIDDGWQTVVQVRSSHCTRVLPPTARECYLNARLSIPCAQLP